MRTVPSLLKMSLAQPMPTTPTPTPAPTGVQNQGMLGNLWGKIKGFGQAVSDPSEYILGKVEQKLGDKAVQDRLLSKSEPMIKSVVDKGMGIIKEKATSFLKQNAPAILGTGALAMGGMGAMNSLFSRGGNLGGQAAVTSNLPQIPGDTPASAMIRGGGSKAFESFEPTKVAEHKKCKSFPSLLKSKSKSKVPEQLFQ